MSSTAAMPVLLQELPVPALGALQQIRYLVVDELGSGIAEILRLSQLATEEDLLLLTLEDNGSHGIAHAPAAHHAARQAGGLVEV